jgi:trk system potassium uptake protein TrkA
MPKGHPSHSSAREARMEPRGRGEGELFVVVVGCGRLGSIVANRMSLLGHHVTVIDNREAAFASLSPDYSGFRVEGDATELATLHDADVRDADVVVVATESDNINLMVGQVARKLLGVQRVIARVSDPEREDIFYDLGLETICPATLVSDEIVESLRRDHGIGRAQDR